MTNETTLPESAIPLDGAVRRAATALEIEILANAARKQCDRIATGMELVLRDIATYGTHLAIGREVSAKRGRKLRKLGHNVRYCGRTSTGKARYTWLKRFPLIRMYRA